jgi:hypothetical protein
MQHINKCSSVDILASIFEDIMNLSSEFPYLICLSRYNEIIAQLL